MSDTLIDPALTETHRLDFSRYLATVAPGTTVNANTIRDWVEAAGMPRARLGGLFSHAHAKGYLMPASIAYVTHGAGRKRMIRSWIRTSKAVK